MSIAQFKGAVRPVLAARSWPVWRTPGWLPVFITSVTVLYAAAIVVSAAIHLTAVLVPGLRPVFRTFSMSGAEWTILLVLSASIIPAIEAMKLGDRLLRKK